MSEPQTTSFESSRKDTSFEGRAELDAAWRFFRRSLIALLREGRRPDAPDPETLAKLTPIAAEATQVLRRLANEAQSAVSGSARNRELMEREEAKLRRLLGRAARKGSSGAARMLRTLDRKGPDDAA
ncbi:hypothetical protein ACWDAO_14815 [Streptomyces sp. NPDC001212]